VNYFKGMELKVIKGDHKGKIIKLREFIGGNNRKDWFIEQCGKPVGDASEQELDEYTRPLTKLDEVLK
jgi:hypothetical protein